MTKTIKSGRYLIGSADALTVEQLRHLQSCFENAEKPSEGILSGRSSSLATSLQGFGPVVIKSYFRGGLIRHVIKRTYLGFGNSRSKAEFDMLQHVRRIGVNAPEPVAYAVQGRLFYRAWLVTKQIRDAESLSDLGFSNPEKARKSLPEIAGQINILIRHGIHHVDLHPGNVLIDSKGHAWFIDFDKAGKGVLNKQRLRHRYMERWERAADKYRLPSFVRKVFKAGDSK